MLEKNIMLIKAAVQGPMGDKVKEMSLNELRTRVYDQAEKMGVYPPADPALIDAVRACKSFMVLMGDANPKPFVVFIYPQESGSIGQAIAQRITAAFTSHEFKDVITRENGSIVLPYQAIADLVYQECLALTRELNDGDWLEMPNGDTFTKTFTAKKI